MKEIILGVAALIFATIYNLVLFTLNLECADDKFVNTTILLISVNTLKDAVILGIILYKIFLG